MDHRIVPGNRGCELRRVANVAVDDPEVGIVTRQKGVAEEHDVIDRDLVATLEQLRDQPRPAISGSAGHQHFVEQSLHDFLYASLRRLPAQPEAEKEQMRWCSSLRRDAGGLDLVSGRRGVLVE